MVNKEAKDTLYTISKSITDLEEKILKAYDEETGEIKDPELYDEILKIDTDVLAEKFTKKCEGIIKFIVSREAKIKEIKEEEKRISEYRKSLEKDLVKFKSYVSYVLQHTGLDKVETNVGKISIRKSESIKITDDAVLPKEYLTEKIEVKPNKVELKKAIKSGLVIAGVSLESKKNIAIK